MVAMIKVDDASVVAMVRDVLTREKGSREGQSTYLRALTAAVQVELGSEPRMAGGRGRIKGVTIEAAMEAVAQAHGRFYAIVLTELDPNLDARTRNGQSGFARSAVSTLRAAVKAGLNPLEIVLPALTKEWLRAWAKQHKTPDLFNVTDATRKARLLLRRLGEVVAAIPDKDKGQVMDFVHKELEALDAVVQYSPGEGHDQTHVIPTRGRARGESRVQA